jgi:hypothetical protein
MRRPVTRLASRLININGIKVQPDAQQRHSSARREVSNPDQI